jgi:hypothetical protein
MTTPTPAPEPHPSRKRQAVAAADGAAAGGTVKKRRGPLRREVLPSGKYNAVEYSYGQNFELKCTTGEIPIAMKRFELVVTDASIGAASRLVEVKVARPWDRWGSEPIKTPPPAWFMHGVAKWDEDGAISHKMRQDTIAMRKAEVAENVRHSLHRDIEEWKSNFVCYIDDRNDVWIPTHTTLDAELEEDIISIMSSMNSVAVLSGRLGPTDAFEFVESRIGDADNRVLLAGFANWSDAETGETLFTLVEVDQHG